MKKHDNESNKSDPVNPKSSADPRRNLLKKLAVGGVAGAALPTQWSKPVIDSVILPAHAQTTTGTIVGGGGGGGGIVANTPAGGESLTDFFVNPAHAAVAVDDYCLEIDVHVAGGVIDGVTVTKVCYNACKPNTRWHDREISPVDLDGEGTTWAGNVDGFSLLLANVNPNGPVLANAQYGGVNGVIKAGFNCTCSCVVDT